MVGREELRHYHPQEQRQHPDVFDVFAIGGPATVGPPRGGVALPGLSSSVLREEPCWAMRLAEQNRKWSLGPRDPCERPRTYDKFYQRSPANFWKAHSSMCSNEVASNTIGQRRRDLSTSSKDISCRKTLTDSDMKHIERHLSMKRTIRKKIMRDLQQAFLNKDSSGTKSLITRSTDVLDDSRWSPDAESLNLGSQDGKVHGHSEPNLLELLRDSEDSGIESPGSMRGQRSRALKKKHRDNSVEDIKGFKSDTIARIPRARTRREHKIVEPPPDYCDDMTDAENGKDRKTFWQRLVGRRWEKGK